jgi:IS6 family transposase
LNSHIEEFCDRTRGSRQYEPASPLISHGSVIAPMFGTVSQFPISSRELELMLQDRNVSVDRTTIFRWILAYAPELEMRLRPHLRLSNGSWRADETDVKVKGRWTHLYRAVDSRGQTIDFLLSAKRGAEAAKRFFRKSLG